jgi:hypothetical protein
MLMNRSGGFAIFLRFLECRVFLTLYIFIFFSLPEFLKLFLPLDLFYSFLKNPLTVIVSFNARFVKFRVCTRIIEQGSTKRIIY